MVTLLTFVIGALVVAGGTADGLHPPTAIRQALADAFEAPGATWTSIRQPFWPHVLVFKLTAVSDRRWYHRPTIAIDRTGASHVITDGIFHIPPEAPLEAFNALAVSEQVAVDSSNIEQYAVFFLKAFLLYSEDTCLSSSLPTFPETGSLPTGLCREELPLRVSRRGSGFVLDTVVVHRTTRAAQAHCRP